jgi:hypothetical protein
LGECICCILYLHLCDQHHKPYTEMKLSSNLFLILDTGTTVCVALRSGMKITNSVRGEMRIAKSKMAVVQFHVLK